MGQPRSAAKAALLASVHSFVPPRACPATSRSVRRRPPGCWCRYQKQAARIAASYVVHLVVFVRVPRVTRRVSLSGIAASSADSSSSSGMSAMSVIRSKRASDGTGSPRSSRTTSAA